MTNWNTDANNVVLSGYDTVAYHQEHKAIRGSTEHQADFDGAKFYFVSDENRDAFVEAPDQYLPRFGGHCAFAMAANNDTAPADPLTFKIYQGNLLLFFNDYYEGKPFNTIVPWNQDEVNMLGQAEANWATHARS